MLKWKEAKSSISAVRSLANNCLSQVIKANIRRKSQVVIMNPADNGVIPPNVVSFPKTRNPDLIMRKQTRQTQVKRHSTKYLISSSNLLRPWKTREDWIATDQRKPGRQDNWRQGGTWDSESDAGRHKGINGKTDGIQIKPGVLVNYVPTLFYWVDKYSMVMWSDNIRGSGVRVLQELSVLTLKLFCKTKIIPNKVYYKKETNYFMWVSPQLTNTYIPYVCMCVYIYIYTERETR